MNDKVMLETGGLSVGYGKREVVSDINVKIHEGEITALIGENGCGKSTLLKTLIGEIPVLAGKVEIDGRDVSGLTAKETAKLISVVMTGVVKTDYFTCRDMVASGRYPYTGALGRLTDNDENVIYEAMRLTGTCSLKDAYITRVSDGQRQLVMLARAIAQEPKILVLDEPTNFLDIKHRRLFADVIRDLAEKKHICVIMSMHELEIVKDLADAVIAIKGGKINKQGNTSEILNEKYINELFDI